MSLESGWSERSAWDPRENQVPVYVGAAACSVYGSYHCSEVLFKTRNFSRRLPVVALAAGASALTAYNIWQKTVLRPERAAEYGTWRSCPECDKYSAFCLGFVANGLTALMAGSAATTLYDSSSANKKVPRFSIPPPKRLITQVFPLLLFWQVAFASGCLGFAFAHMKISHEMDMYQRANPKNVTSPKESAV